MKKHGTLYRQKPNTYIVKKLTPISPKKEPYRTVSLTPTVRTAKGWTEVTLTVSLRFSVHGVKHLFYRSVILALSGTLR